MQKFVLDANLFFNMEPGLGMGRKTQEVVMAVTKRIKEKKAKSKVEFLLPPRILDEFLSFFDDKEQPFIKELLGVITIQSPNITTLSFPAAIFYELVKDIRERSYRGLTIAQEEVEAAAQKVMGKGELNKKDFQIAVGPVVKNLRERYRQATRYGFLDSVADLDLIVLSKETEATLVTTDEGVLKWGRVFGVKEMDAPTFGRYLQQEG